MANERDMRTLILLTLMIGTFLGRLDQTVVNLALPKIMTDFSINIGDAGWIATAYILANAVFVPVWGKLGDTIGRKKVYLWGFLIFIIGSVLAGISWDLGSMLVFRVIQAVASSADYPTAMAILAVTYKDPKERGQALGLWSTSFAASAVFGLLLGGPLIDAFGWRSVFLINLPVGILGLAMAIAFVPESVSEKRSAKFDWGGALALGLALSALVLVLDKGMSWGWTSQASLLAYAAILTFGYLFYRIDSVHPEPVVDLKFFRIPAFVGALANNFIVFMGMITSLFLLPQFIQIFLGFDATQTGYLFLPMSLGMFVSAPLGASLVGKVEARYVIAASTAIAALGMFLFIGAMDPRATTLSIIIPLVVLSFGLGLGMAQRTNIVASTVPEKEIGIASSILALVRNIAGAFGIALSATLLQNATKGSLAAISHYSIINTSNPLLLGQAAALMELRAYIDGYRHVFLVSALILLAGAVLALTLKVKEKKTTVHVIAD